MTLLAERIATDGPRFAEFARRNLRHTIGQFAGDPFTLEPWQQDFVDELLAIDPETGRRYYTEALLGIPRKNGKSSVCAALGLYFLTSDGEEGPQVYVGAAARDQARVIFDQAQAFVDKSPALQRVVNNRQYDIVARSGGKFRVLSSDAKLQHGLNPSANLIDELWAHEDAELYTALTSGTGARVQPLTVTITTAGWDETSALGQMYQQALAMGNLERPTPYLTIGRDREHGFLFWWYGAPDTADADDPAVWLGTNPASWITEDYLRRERFKPSSREADFKRLHLNIWTSTEQPWLPPGSWQDCLDPNAVILHDLPVGVGLDKGETYDSTAVVLAQRQGERVVIRLGKAWQNPYPPGHKLRDSWQVNTEEVRTYLRELYETYPVAAGVDEFSRVRRGPAFAFDPWHFAESADMLAHEQLNMLKFPQNMSRLVPASEQFFELVKARRIAHANDEVLTQHVTAATAELTQRGWKLARPRNGRQVDAAFAAAMAVSMAMVEAPAAPRKRTAMVSF